MNVLNIYLPDHLHGHKNFTTMTFLKLGAMYALLVSISLALRMPFCAY